MTMSCPIKLPSFAMCFAWSGVLGQLLSALKMIWWVHGIRIRWIDLNRCILFRKNLFFFKSKVVSWHHYRLEAGTRRLTGTLLVCSLFAAVNSSGGPLISVWLFCAGGKACLTSHCSPMLLKSFNCLKNIWPDNLRNISKHHGLRMYDKDAI